MTRRNLLVRSFNQRPLYSALCFLALVGVGALAGYGLYRFLIAIAVIMEF